MAEPIVTIINLDKAKISDEEEFQNAYLTFSFNEPVYAYSVRSMGTNQETGINADWKDLYVETQALKTIAELSLETVQNVREIPANTEIVSEINYTELYQEGENQINVYGRSANDGVWSTYQQS